MSTPRHFERLWIAVVCGLVAWFDLWTLESTGRAWNFGAEQNDYYNLLIDGWLDGQLHMKVDVPDALLKLRDPYDPAQRPAGVGLHDASLCRGKYYLYFGAAPLVVLMLPFRIVTGVDLPVAFAVLVFVYGGFLASAAVWLRMRRRYFPEASTVVVVLCLLALGGASLAPVLLRRPQMWELPIAAGYCFAMLALCGLEAALHATQHRARWLAAAAMALGLAIASRPPYLFATPLLGLPLLVWWREERRLDRRAALAAALPLVVVGALLALHNYARFGNPLEFGQTYQLTYFDERKTAHFSLRYAGFNGWRYFFSRAQWSAYFPFIAPAELPPKPPGFSGHDDVYGVLANLPLAWFALLAPLAGWKRPRLERARLDACIAGAGMILVAEAALLLCFFGSLARYEVDFTPALMLLACVGVLAIERLTESAPGFVRRSVRLAWTAPAVAAMVFAVLFSLQYDGQLQRHNPAKAAAVARVLNWIPYVAERVTGVKHGGLEIEIRRSAAPAREEMLLSIGAAPNADRVLLRPVDGRRVQLVIAPAEMPEIASRVLALDFSRSHTLRVVLGSLLPPETHPLFRPLSADARLDLTRRVWLELDGEPLIDERRDLATTGGVRHVRTAAGARVAGHFAVEPAPAATSFVRIRFSLPDNVTVPREPLIAFRDTSDARAAGVLFVHYIDDAGQVAFGTSIAGERGPETESVTIEPARVHELVARWFAAEERGRSRLELRLDGAIVSSREVRWPSAAAAQVFGRNSSDEPGCAAAFTGVMHMRQPAPDGRDPLVATRGDGLRLRLRFPPGHPGAREPLVVTGRTGAGDLLVVEYVDERTIRFALDHWGGPALLSAPVRVDFAKSHELTVATSALWGESTDIRLRMTRRGALRVQLDGSVVWHTPAPTFAARPDELAIGANPIGGTSCSARFSGDILSAERIARPNPRP